MTTDPIPYTLTTATDSSGCLVEAVAVRWGDIEEHLGQAHLGTPLDDERVFDALRRADAPRWATSMPVEVDTDEQHWIVLGPEAALPLSPDDDPEGYFVVVEGEIYTVDSVDELDQVKRLLARLGVDFVPVLRGGAPDTIKTSLRITADDSAQGGRVVPRARKPKPMTGADIVVHVGRRLRARMDEIGRARDEPFTMRELGQYLGREHPMPRQNVARILGGASCSVASLLAACEVLDLDPADVLEGLELGAGQGPDLAAMSVGELAALALRLGTTASDLLRGARK